jgi:thymidine phosphorylase
MFGLEDQKKKKGKADEFVFELENELLDRNKGAKIKAHVEEQIKNIKNVLRSGESQDEFNRFGQLLHGYTSFLKVMARLKNPVKR